jgi:hypothetical protein
MSILLSGRMNCKVVSKIHSVLSMIIPSEYRFTAVKMDSLTMRVCRTSLEHTKTKAHVEAVLLQLICILLSETI